MSHYFYITPDEYAEAENNGISAHLLGYRVRSLAWTKERAINTPPRKKNSLKDWVEIAANNGICYGTLRYRINRLGWDPEIAATQPIQDRKAQAQMMTEKRLKLFAVRKRRNVEC